MISEKEYNIVVLFVKLCCLFGLLPADWNPQTNKLTYPSAKKWKSYSSLFLLPFHVGYIIFIQFRIFGELQRGSGVDKILLHCLFTCAHALCSLYHCHILASPREIAYLFNLIANFNQNQGVEILNGEAYRPPRIRQAIVVSLPSGVAAIIIAVAATAFLKATSTNYVYSVFPFHNPIWLTIFGMLECVPLFFIYCLANFTFVFTLYYIMSTRFWLNRIRQLGSDSDNAGISTDANTTPGFKSFTSSQADIINRKLKFYKMLYIMNDMFNRSWANLMLPGFKFLIIIVLVSALYGTIRFPASVEFLVFIWCPMMALFLGTIIVLIPPLFASLQEMSVPIIMKRDDGYLRNAVSSGKNSRLLELRIVSRVLESCTPLTCRAGSFYIFDRNTGLTCLNLVIQMTAYFLVAG